LRHPPRSARAPPPPPSPRSAQLFATQATPPQGDFLWQAVPPRNGKAGSISLQVSALAGSTAVCA
jgi:hypothetical protein